MKTQHRLECVRDLPAKKTSEDLKCPLDGPGTGDKTLKTAPYKNFLTNVCAFRKINRLPQKLCFDEGVTVEEFVAHRAKWHKSCCRKFAKDPNPRQITLLDI